MSGIYKIQSRTYPDRFYIGGAIGIPRRWREHLRSLRNKKHENSRLQNHFNKYGEDDLLFSILLECPKEQLIAREQDLIDALEPWFNICKIAGSILGIKRSEETKVKLREQKLGAKNPMYGKHHSEERKQQMRNIALLNGNTPPKHNGLRRSEESRQRYRDGVKKRPTISEETRLLMRESRINYLKKSV
jgi:group I intron endonuclease